MLSTYHCGACFVWTNSEIHRQVWYLSCGEAAKRLTLISADTWVMLCFLTPAKGGMDAPCTCWRTKGPCLSPYISPRRCGHPHMRARGPLSTAWCYFTHSYWETSLPHPSHLQEIPADQGGSCEPTGAPSVSQSVSSSLPPTPPPRTLGRVSRSPQLWYPEGYLCRHPCGQPSPRRHLFIGDLRGAGQVDEVGGVDAWYPLSIF
jgi:hypothetical protein